MFTKIFYIFNNKNQQFAQKGIILCSGKTSWVYQSDGCENFIVPCHFLRNDLNKQHHGPGANDYQPYKVLTIQMWLNIRKSIILFLEFTTLASIPNFKF